VSKLIVLSELLPYAATVPKTDIFNYEKGDPYVKELKEQVKIKSIASTRKIQRSYRRFIKSMSVAISMMTREKDRPVQIPVVSQLTTTFGLVYDSVLNMNIDRKTNLFYSQVRMKYYWWKKSFQRRTSFFWSFLSSFLIFFAFLSLFK